MAIKSTIFKAHLQLADIDHGYYADHAFTLARHPSETDERMMVRLAALALQAFEQVDSDAQAKKNIVQAIESVAKKLGNTPTICRKCYVHPAVLEAYLDGSLWEGMRARARQQLQDDLPALAPEEAAVLALLQQRLQAAVKPGAQPAAGTGPTV